MIVDTGYLFFGLLLLSLFSAAWGWLIGYDLGRREARASLGRT